MKCPHCGCCLRFVMTESLDGDSEDYEQTALLIRAEIDKDYVITSKGEK